MFAAGFHIIIGLLFLCFWNRQPLKSRFIGPYLALAGIYVNLIMEFLLTLRSFEISSRSYCIDSILFSYAPLQMACAVPLVMFFRYIILLKIHENKRKFIRNVGTESNSLLATDVVKYRRWKIFLKRIMTILSSPWIFTFVPVFWTGLYLVISFSVYAFSEFRCSTNMFVSLRYIYVGMFLFCVLAIAGLICFDLLMNIRFIIKCKWKKIFFDDDPFHFRLDMICLLGMIPPVIIWTLISMPMFLYGIVGDILVYGSMWSGGVQALLITIIKSIIFRYRKNKTDFKLRVDAILSNENILEIFVRFCESEWSVENILFKLDIEKYKNTKSTADRIVISEQMRIKYLTAGVSELEINAPHRILNDISKLILEGSTDDNLFLPLEKCADLNLTDTISRFQFSSVYLNYLKEMENKEKSLGL